MKIHIIIILITLNSVIISFQDFQTNFQKLQQYKFMTDHQIYKMDRIKHQTQSDSDLQYNKYMQQFGLFNFTDFHPDPEYLCFFYLDGKQNYPATFFFTINQKSLFEGELSVDLKEQKTLKPRISFSIFDIKNKRFLYGKNIFFITVFQLKLEAGEYIGFINSLDEEVKHARFQARATAMVQEKQSKGSYNQQLYKKLLNIQNTVKELINEHETDVLQSTKHKNVHHNSIHKQYVYTGIQLAIIIIGNIIQFIYIKKLFEIKTVV